MVTDKLPYEAAVWRSELIDNAADVERAIMSPPPRERGETLLAYVRRTRRLVDKHLDNWHRANRAMHEAIKRSGG